MAADKYCPVQCALIVYPADPFSSPKVFSFEEFSMSTRRKQGHTLKDAIEQEFSGSLEDGYLSVVKCARDKTAYFAERKDESLREWVIIELQGDLKHSSGDTTNGQFIGDLHFTEDGIPILIIGIHVLYGKELALAKPFGVLEKIRRNKDDDTTDLESENAETTTEYIVKAVVKKKLIFKGRPKPIVTDVPICI